MTTIRVLAFLCACAMASGSDVSTIQILMNDGRQMPAIALGTYLGFDQNGIVQPKNNEVRDVIRAAIDKGWRHIDTAAVYGTESEVGEAVRDKIEEGVVRREDIFITTKLWNTHHKREQVASALKESLKHLGVNYVDLYLIHWPVSLNEDNTLSDVDFMETWRGMEDVQKLGLARSIGVSNFNEEQLARVIAEGSVKPAALQVEVHPQIVQSKLVEYAQSQGVVVMGYSPFGSLVSRYGMDLPPPKIDDPILTQIAKKYGKTTPQIVLRWAIDRKIVPIPKTTNIKRLDENIAVFDFKLDEKEVTSISDFNKNLRYTLPSFWQDNPYYPFEKVENPVANPFVKKE